MNKVILILAFILSFVYLKGQTDNYTTSKKIDNLLLIDLIEYIESESNLKFFFKDEWINNINISITNNEPMVPQLQRQLEPNNLNLYIEGNNIYLMKDKELIVKIPEYNSTKNILNSEKRESELTDVEENYLQSKKIVFTEVLYVGQKNGTPSNKPCIINGKISDLANGEPMIGATLYIEELKTGTTTDVDGNFKLVAKPGYYKLIVSHMSMKQQEYYLQVYSNGSLDLEMSKELMEIKEVVVSGHSVDNVKGMQMGFERLTAKTMKEIPVVLGEKDLIKVAILLPGVENVGEGSSGFNVRGGAADQNMFYINKIPVYNTSHLFGFFTSFSPDVVNNFTLYKSNIPAKYGGRLSSIFDVSTRQGNKKEFFGQGGINPVTSHFSFEGPIIKDKSSVVTSWRSSYTDWLLNRVDNFDLEDSHAFFYDVTLGVNTDINNKNLLKVFGYNSFDKFNLSTTNDYKYTNSGASVTWKHVFPSSITGDFSAVYSKYLFDNTEKSNPTDAYSHEYIVENIETKADFTYVTSHNHTILFGAHTTKHIINRGDILPYGEQSDRMPIHLGTEKGIEGALYLSDEFKLFSRLSLLAGLRYSFFAELGPKTVYEYFDGVKDVNNIKSVENYKRWEIIKFHANPELRTSLNYTLTPSASFKASYNRLNQYVFMLSNTIAISPNDQWKLVGSNITPPVVDQVSLGIYQNLFKNGFETNIEVYQKWIDHLVEYKDGADFISSDPIETQILQGNQDTKGLEVMLKKKSGRFTGWMSYSYSESFVQVNGDNPEERINQGNKYRSNYDRPHSLNIVVNHHFKRRYSISANYVYSTGRPITLPISAYYSEGQQLLHFSERNKYRLPDYIRLDFSINIEGNLKEKKLAHSYWMINVYNAMGRKNAYSIYYQAVDGNLQGYKLSIFARPIITISWNYKFGNYLSE